jgi:hypothetical protein
MLFLAVLAVAGSTTLTVTGQDQPKPAASVEKAKDSVDLDLLCQVWKHSREEEKPGDIGQLFRPADGRKFRISRFRMMYSFSKDGSCKWYWLAPNDAHEVKPGTWTMDPKDPAVLHIDMGELGGKKAFRIVELTKDALRLEEVKLAGVKER